MMMGGLQLGSTAATRISGLGFQGGIHWRGSSAECSSCISRVRLQARTMNHKFSETGEGSSSSTTGGSFEEGAYEAERLKLDAEARSAMKATADDEEGGKGPESWKWVIRNRVWDSMETTNCASVPRPVHHRIPNFQGAAEAAARMASLPAFKAARCVKVNPDTPQKMVRFLTLNSGKKLLTPQPRLRTGFFSSLEKTANVPENVQLMEVCTSAGAAKYGEPIGLDENLKVDLIVIGSVAVDPRTGARLGKGEGFAELEYGMLRLMGAIDDNTPVVTSVHDIQVLEEGTIPTDKLLIHDVPVDVICTPTRTILTDGSIPKPQGIYWEKLSPEKLAQIRILQVLKQNIEEKTGQRLPTAPSERLPPRAKRSINRRARRRPPGRLPGRLQDR